MGVSKNRGTPKSSILIGFSIIKHPFSGTLIFGNTHIYIYTYGQWVFLVHLANSDGIDWGDSSTKFQALVMSKFYIPEKKN